jgi:hypothetical protein
VAADPTIQIRLQALWSKNEEAVMTALEARCNDRTKNLEKNLQEIAEREVTKVRTVMQELQRAIREELERKDGPQMLLDLGGDERAQRERDLSALRRRLNEIPAEIERESAHLRARYKNPTARLFPVAVTFLIPRKLVRGLPGGHS